MVAGAATSVVLSSKVMRGRELVMSGVMGGAMCWAFYKVFRGLGYA